VRKFGRFTFERDPESLFTELGPEPLGETFTPEWLFASLRARKRTLKPLLLDQTFLAGLGNIYVDESLFAAGLHPLARSQRVDRAGAARLHDAIRTTLAAAIEREGSSFDAFYRTPEGQPGQYQHQFRVYGRDGKPCLSCAAPIARIVVGQRGTHFCRACQPRRIGAQRISVRP
jgi:formamidopyrimidine-DNA glycosylase